MLSQQSGAIFLASYPAERPDLGRLRLQGPYYTAIVPLEMPQLCGAAICKTAEASKSMGTYRYWHHFLALESDFAATSRFVEFSTQNFTTFSIEYAKLLLAIGSEVDVLCKIICEKIDSTAKPKNIDHYRACMTAHTQITSEEVLIRRYNLAFKPWSDWASEKNPGWWRSYNNVKHQRDSHFSEANLENCANAISGLFAVVIYCHKAEKSVDSLEPSPILLGREREPSHLLTESGYEIPAFT